MQFSTLFTTIALIATAHAATVKGYAGADCTGAVIGTSTGDKAGDCVFFTNGGSSRSMSWSGVPNKIEFFKSGGPNDKCKGTPQFTSSKSSGCSTAPDGFNWESVKLT